MKDKLARLIDVKSITTILVVLIFCYLSVIGKISGEQFLTVFTVIISFYFGTQHQKNEDRIEDEINRNEIK